MTTKKQKTKIILKGKHLTIKQDEHGKEIFEWDWKKLEKEVAKAISDYEKSQKKKK